MKVNDSMLSFTFNHSLLVSNDHVPTYQCSFFTEYEANKNGQYLQVISTNIYIFFTLLYPTPGLNKCIFGTHKEDDVSQHDKRKKKWSVSYNQSHEVSAPHATNLQSSSKPPSLSTGIQPM